MSLAMLPPGASESSRPALTWSTPPLAAGRPPDRPSSGGRRASWPDPVWSWLRPSSRPTRPPMSVVGWSAAPTLLSIRSTPALSWAMPSLAAGSPDLGVGKLPETAADRARSPSVSFWAPGVRRARAGRQLVGADARGACRRHRASRLPQPACPHRRRCGPGRHAGRRRRRRACAPGAAVTGEAGAELARPRRAAGSVRPEGRLRRHEARAGSCRWSSHPAPAPHRSCAPPW